MSQAILDRISTVIREIGTTKTASVKVAMDDPGDMNGKSSHPSAMPEAKGNERPATEGEQTADNSAIIKDTIANGVDSTSPVTVSSAPKDSDKQVAPATPTGEDPSNEQDYKGTKDDSETSHPANGSIGDKYAHITREWLQTAPDEQLFKMAAELGNEAVAKVAEGHFATTKTAAPVAPVAPATKVAADAAAAAGYNAAAALSEADLEKIAADMLYDSHIAGVEDADNVFAYLQLKRNSLKVAEETEDPMGGSAEGEDHGSEEGGEGAASGSSAPASGGGGDAGSELLAAMGGGGGGDPAAAAGGDPAGGAGPMPPEASQMGGEGALQQLAMALMELGIDPAQLAAAAGGAPAPGGAGGAPMPGGDPMAAMMGGGAPPPAGDPAAAGSPLPKLAQKVAAYKASGKFTVTETKTAAERKVRDWMKSYIKEVTRRK